MTIEKFRWDFHLFDGEGGGDAGGGDVVEHADTAHGGEHHDTGENGDGHPKAKARHQVRSALTRAVGQMTSVQNGKL